MILYTTVAALCSLASRAAAAQEQVLPGIDVLLRAAPRPLAGARVGLSTNHTGSSRTARPHGRPGSNYPFVRTMALALEPAAAWRRPYLLPLEEKR